ncbi:MAG: transcriptional regulator [Desulfobacterales bacterium]|nr:transcriptional regulator [Desulfobacterales bacterium]
MDSKEFKCFRKRLNKTQKLMAQLLGKSIKAIHSYEQGWRAIPTDVERQILFLVSRAESDDKSRKPCWKILKCPPEQKKKCPAWEFNSGKFCWFINGTICAGKPQRSWDEKIKICRECEVLNELFKKDTT